MKYLITFLGFSNCFTIAGILQLYPESFLWLLFSGFTGFSVFYIEMLILIRIAFKRWHFNPFSDS